MQLFCMLITCRREAAFSIRYECLTGVPVQDYTKKATGSYLPYWSTVAWRHWYVAPHLHLRLGEGIR